MPVEISYSKPTCVLYCKMQFGCAGIVVIVPNPKGKLIGSKWQFGQQIDNGTALVVVGTGLEVFVENDGLVVVVVEYQYQVVTNAVAGGVDAGGRSEERRVGKECRSGWAPEHEEKKEESGVEGSR